MFSTEERCVYEKNQLEQVICQLRFPEILAIGAEAPVAFQEAIRSPGYRCSRTDESGKAQACDKPPVCV